MAKKAAAPRINHLSWGLIEIDGYPPFKDAKVYPGGARAWDWTETGTRHVPGIQPGDAAELVEQGVEIVILSKGIQNRLQVPDETIRELESLGIEVQVLQTEDAVRYFNQIRGKKAVGGLFHSTC